MIQGAYPRVWAKQFGSQCAAIFTDCNQIGYQLEMCVQLDPSIQTFDATKVAIWRKDVENSMVQGLIKAVIAGAAELQGKLARLQNKLQEQSKWPSTMGPLSLGDVAPLWCNIAPAPAPEEMAGHKPWGNCHKSYWKLCGPTSIPCPGLGQLVCAWPGYDSTIFQTWPVEPLLQEGIQLSNVEKHFESKLTTNSETQLGMTFKLGKNECWWCPYGYMYQATSVHENGPPPKKAEERIMSKKKFLLVPSSPR